MTEHARWLEVAPGVLVRRHRDLDLSLGLVVGERAALVVDTGPDVERGAEFAAAVRSRTELPLIVVLTHAHFDHCLGTAAFRHGAVWAHRRCREAMRGRGPELRAEGVARYLTEGRLERAAAVRDAPTVLPTALVESSVSLSLGGRDVLLLHPGPAHTDHDLLVHVQDAAVTFTGDLVEQGAAPSFGADSVPECWPLALDAVLGLLDRSGTAVPGHGDPVDAAFVAEQRRRVAAVAELRAEVRAGRTSVEEGLRRSPYPERTTREALDA